MRLFMLCMLIAVSGCATVAPPEERLAHWTGAPSDDLVAKWGYPQSTMELPNGNKVMVYLFSETQTTTPQYDVQSGFGKNDYTVTQRQPSSNTWWCKYHVEVDKTSKKITHLKWDGNNC